MSLNLYLLTYLLNSCRYNFRATIKDDTASAPFIFFTPKADEYIGVNCADLVAANTTIQAGHLPDDIQAIVGRTHTFQFHYNSNCNPRYIEFVIDEVFGITDKAKQITGQSSGE